MKTMKVRIQEEYRRMQAKREREFRRLREAERFFRQRQAVNAAIAGRNDHDRKLIF